MFNRKSAIATALLALGTVCAGTAHAANVQWSIGINLPVVGTVISSEPMYQEPRPYYAPAPVYVEPAPVVVYRPEPRVVYRPDPYYAPRFQGPQVIRSGWAVPPRGWHHDHDRYDERGHDRYDHRDGRHDEYGDSRNGDRWSQEPRREHH
ncbi:MAG: hypothetical protein ABI605_11980 [Rhizobacter sp.]